MHDCFTIELTGECLKCLFRLTGGVPVVVVQSEHYGRVSQRYRFESRRGQWALFSLIPSALSFVFL